MADISIKEPGFTEASNPDKGKTPSEKAKRTATWAKTMTKVVISQNNGTAPFWHVINFLGPGKSEPRGIVDLLAIRKNQGDHALPLKRGDLFDVVLIQVKGGSSKMPTSEDRDRLRVVGKAYNAKEILLSEWIKGCKAMFKRLVEDEWVTIEPAAVFGPRIKTIVKAKSAQLLSKNFTLSTVSKVKKLNVLIAPLSLKSSAAKKAWVTRRAASENVAV